jgi:hypothetical protein
MQTPPLLQPFDQVGVAPMAVRLGSHFPVVEGLKNCRHVGHFVVADFAGLA